MIGVMEPDDAAVAAQLNAVSAALRGKLPGRLLLAAERRFVLVGGRIVGLVADQ